MADTRLVLIYTDDVQAHESLVSRFPDIPIEITDSDETYAHVAKEAEVIFVARKYDVAPLRKARNLRWLHLGGTGINPLLPLSQWPIELLMSHTPGLNAAMIADYVQAAFAMLAWNLPRYIQNQQARRWQKWGAERLEGKTVLILGLGAIGTEIVRRANAAGMKVIAIRRRPVEQDGVKHVATPDKLKEMLPQADFVVLALPLTTETHHLIDSGTLSVMRRDAYLINVSRGAIVDEHALASGLVDGQIAGAMLDVFEEEPLSPQSPLWQLPNAIITPHIASWSADYRVRAAAIFAENLERFLAGQAPQYQIDRSREY